MPSTGQAVTCANCGQLFAATDVVFIGNSYVCGACKPLFLQRMREGSAGGAVGARRYAGFWIRVGAYIIDLIIIYAATFVLGFVVSLPLGALRVESSLYLLYLGVLSILAFVSVAGYHGYFLSTKGATPGKLLLGLKVIRSDGSGLSFMRGVGRLFAHFVSGIILYVGYIIVAFDVEKRALHDHLCDTRVVYK